MKTYRFYLIIALLHCSALTFAQVMDPPPPPPDNFDDRREEIEAMKIGFLTKRLDLSADEAQKFWPVYNKFQDEMERHRKARRMERKDMKEEFGKMSDADAEKLVDGEIAFRQQELDLVKKYHAQFKQVLPIKKVAMLYRTEEDFKRELLKRIQERRQEDRPMKQNRRF